MTESTPYTPEFKARAVLDMLTSAKSAAEISAEHAIPVSVLDAWREFFLAHAPLVFEMAAEKYTQAMNPAARDSLERSIRENADVWAELAKH